MKNHQNKIEIIEIDLRFNLEEKIKEYTDNISSIDSHVKTINEKNNLKILNKKQKEDSIWNDRLEKIYELLHGVHSHENPYRSTSFIFEALELNLSKSETIGLTKRLTEFLKKEKNGNFILQTKKSNGKNYYALIKFG